MKQASALNILRTGVNVFLTGEPGAGKTHTINAYIAWLRERGVDVSVTASTGIAATHVGGMTIHSWSGIGVKETLSDWDVDAILSREPLVRRHQAAKVLIIDEISMLDGRSLDSVDRVLRAVRNKDLPFGGIQVVFVGDFFQLPPVSHAPQFAFESRAWRDANPIVCYLSEQHRHADIELSDVLTGIRHGALTDAHRRTLEARTGKSSSAVTTRLYTHNENVERLNDEALTRLPGNAKRYDMTSRGTEARVASLKKSCISPETLLLKEGASVMFTRNNFDAGYVNGTLGIVESFSASGAPLVRTRSGKRVTVEPVEWAMQDGSKVLAKITQLPLRLAWAITVHKSQGMSLESAHVDLSHAFEYGQGYVALSRVRSLSGLFLDGLNEQALRVHPSVSAADSRFREASSTAEEHFANLAATALDDLHQRFLTAIGAQKPVTAKSKKKPAGTYPNAGAAWKDTDDALLKAMFSEKRAIKDIAAHFGRKPSAIRARLARHGLIKDFWAARRS